MPGLGPSAGGRAGFGGGLGSKCQISSCLRSKCCCSAEVISKTSKHVKTLRGRSCFWHRLYAFFCRFGAESVKLGAGSRTVSTTAKTPKHKHHQKSITTNTPRQHQQKNNHQNNSTIPPLPEQCQTRVSPQLRPTRVFCRESHRSITLRVSHQDCFTKASLQDCEFSQERHTKNVFRDLKEGVFHDYIMLGYTRRVLKRASYQECLTRE